VVGASVVSVLKRQLLEANRRLAAVLRQKENLSGTCQSRGEYIEELTSQADALRSQNALYESALCEKDSQYRQACEQVDWLTVQAEEAGKAHNCLEQEKESLLAQLDRTTQRLDSVAGELNVVLDKYRQAQETIRQLRLAGDNRSSVSSPCSGIDAAVQQAQQAISQFRTGFSFRRTAQTAGQNPADVDGTAESAPGQSSGNPAGKTKSLQSRLAILGGTDPEQA
jgi:chromosome segregation ATPase